MGVQRAAGELTIRPTHRTLAGSGSRLLHTLEAATYSRDPTSAGEGL